MSGKLSKKGRNPGVVDKWLDEMNLYRKNVAYDETCLFRAVSEQLFECQVFQERVRKECIAYGRKHFEEFHEITNNKENWYRHLDMLEKHMVICGNIEIQLISKQYKRDVIIYHANTQKIYDVTNCNFSSTPLRLCLMDEDHYDAVYEKKHIVDAGFCQSIVYKVLYEEVFKIPNVDSIVNAMLYEKTHIINQIELEERKQNNNGQDLNPEDLGGAVIAPFPFKVAKALDASIYRNIEYDSWGEVRRELRLGDWYYGDDKLKLGTKCILRDKQSGDLDCYIQEMLRDKEKCVVFLTKTAEKRIVNYSDLAPESNAQPWQLPYRFSKNLAITQLQPIDRIKNMRKKNKEKKSKSLSESGASDGIDHIRRTFGGAPLQMQDLNQTSSNSADVSTDTSGAIVPYTDGLPTPVSPDVNHYQQRCYWEQIHWSASAQYVPPQSQDSSFYSQATNPFVWPHTPATPYYDYKPAMIASAPVTPSVIPYHDPAYPYYCYHIEQGLQQPLTPITPSVFQAVPQRSVEISETPQVQISVTEESIVEIPSQNSAEANAAQRQAVEAYHSMVTISQDATEMEQMVTSSTPIYTPCTPSPSMDMQYLIHPPYVYPAQKTSSAGQNSSAVPNIYASGQNVSGVPNVYSPGQNVPPVPTVYYSGQNVATVPNVYTIAQNIPAAQNIYYTSQNVQNLPNVYSPVQSVPTAPSMYYNGQNVPNAYVSEQNLPTTPWYTHPGFPCNSQGFIFPQPNNKQYQNTL